MNNEINQNLMPNTQLNQQIPIQQPVQQPINQQVATQSIPKQQTLAQLVQKAQPEKSPPVDFNSLSPLEKQQLIDRAIKEAELKCKIEKPKGFNKLTSFIVGMVLMCIACVIILNVLK